MKIPYGIADFAEIRRNGDFYVDKTPFLERLERRDLKNIVFLRPRRMGKSSLLSMMAHYYDASRADQFDELFGGLWVHEHPTAEKNAHVVLHLNLGSVRGTNEDEIKVGFAECIQRSLDILLPRIVALGPGLRNFNDRRPQLTTALSLLNGLMGAVGSVGRRLYVMIDEYDTFANSLISSGSKDVYETLTEHTGFIRQFYATLKAGSETGLISRIFITGVSPILLDDLYTGFNISTNITTDPDFLALAGFTRNDVERALEQLLSSAPLLAEDPRIGQRTVLLDTLERYYNGYRFSPRSSERVFNSDMVLYFLAQLQKSRAYPAQMLDPNARTDYKKFYGLFHASGQPAEERREVLTSVLTEGNVSGKLLETFGRTPSPPAREQFISLLFYTGMLTLSAEPALGWLTKFEVPNLVIRELQWEHFSSLLKESAGIEMVIPAIVAGQRDMAFDGAIKPFLQAIFEHVMKILGLKDLRNFNEKALKMILITSAVLSGIFHVLTEKEMAQGFCDLFFVPRIGNFYAKYSWLMELKYLPAKATEKDIEKAFKEAETQIEKYAHDPALIPILTKSHSMKAAALIFVGAKEIRCRSWPKGAEEEIVVPTRNVTAKKSTKKKVTSKKKSTTAKRSR